MSPILLSYTIFIIAFIVSLIVDIVLFGKKNTEVSLKSALVQYLFWVLIAIGYFVYLYVEFGSHLSLNYLSAYFMEMSLSIDNIFVFVLIFSAYKVDKQDVSKVLTIGVLIAILLRILFITVGIIIVNKFSWVLYIFGVILLYTGIKLFFQNPEDETQPNENKISKWLEKYIRITNIDPNGRFTIKHHGKIYFTTLFLVICTIGVTDIVFALDSIPAVFAITTNNLVVYSSNIFALLGLRAVYFILSKASTRFDFLQQGIAIVLVFVGLKMLLEIVHIHVPVWLSLIVIIICVVGSIIYSIHHNRKNSRLSSL